MTRWLARRRVAMGFGLAAFVLWLARPEWPTVVVGGAIAVCGELLRTWAAGHLEKSTEVTSSGPYRYLRHPLYAGSTLIGIGMAIASASLVVAAIIGAYLALTLTAARRTEERHLREKFGDAYDAYADRRATPIAREFSWTRALRNREHHAMAGLAAALAIFAVKAYYRH